MKKKTWFKKIIIVIMIISIGVLLGTKKIKKKSSYSILSFLSNNEIVEKDIREIANTMYVTLLDKKAKVVATTKSNTEVDSDYQFSDTQVPRKQPNTTDDYYVLFNIKDTNGENGYTKVEEDIIYTMDLPKEIIPSNAYEEGITPTQKCSTFTKKGKSIACGGIYQKDGNYQFKVIFNDVLNKKDVEAAYQFPIKINKTIEESVFSVKTIDFGLPGAIQLYIKKEEIVTPPQQDEKPYTVEVHNNGWTSYTQNYTKWTVTITDNHTDGYKMNGTLYIDFGPDMGMSTDRRHWFENMNVYMDEIKLRNTGSISASEKITNYYSNSDNSNLYIRATVEEEGEIDFKTSYSYIAKQLKIDINQVVNNSETIEGVKTWKFEFLTKEYHEDSDFTYTTNVAFIDNLDTETNYEKMSSISKGLSNSLISFSSTKQDVNQYYVAEKIHYTLNISNTRNILEIEDVPNDSLNNSYRYFLDGIGFALYSDELSPTLQFMINGQKINFKKDQYSASSVVSGQLDDADPAVQRLMKKTDNYSGSSDSTYYKSEQVNQDGDYYWLVLSNETKSYRNSLQSNASRFDFIRNDSSDPNYVSARWKVYLFNAKNTTVQVDWDEYLHFTKGIDKYLTDKTEERYHTTTVNNQTTNNRIQLVKIAPITTKSSIIDENYIKWDVKVDLNAIYADTSKMFNSYVLINLPPNMVIEENMNYDYKNNKIVNSSTDNTMKTNRMIACKNWNKSKYQYDNGECEEWLVTEEIRREESFYQQITYQLSKRSTTRDFDYLTNEYSLPYSNKKWVGVITSDGIDTQNKFLRFSFITRNDSSDDRTNESYSDDIYIEVIGTSFRKNYNPETASHRGDSPEPYFATTTKASVVYPKITKYTEKQNQKYSWAIVNQVIDSARNTSYELNAFQSSTYLPILYNGKYQFTDKFQTNTQEEEIVARNTKVKSIKVSIYSMEAINYDNNYSQTIEIKDYTTLPIDSEGYYTYCTKEKKCLKLKYNYGENCQTYTSDNPNCTRENENMKNGFEIIIEGIYKSQQFVTTYTTETDMIEVKKELDENQLNKTSIEIKNQASQYNWQTHKNLVQTVDKSQTYEILADLSIEKKVDMNADTNYKNDTKKQEVVATVGTSPSDYLEITDFIDGIGNLSITQTTVNNEDIITNYNDLKEIRKYLSIRDLTISIKGHNDDTYSYKNIYTNGNFSPEYANSTFQIINDTNELYKLHLVRSEGEKIPALTDVKITYTMNFYLDQYDNYRLKDIYDGKKFYISTNAEAIRTYDSTTNPSGISNQGIQAKVKKMSSRDGDYSNKIDNENHTLTTYASNRGAEVGADYLYPPEIIKTSIESPNKDTSRYLIQYTINSTGKSEKVKMKIQDTFNFRIEGDSIYENDIINILNENSLYKNIKIYYNGKSTSLEQNPIYEWENILENKTINANSIQGKITTDEKSYGLELSSFNYGDVVMITYDIQTDYETVMKKIIEKGYVNEKLELKDTKQKLSIYLDNEVVDIIQVKSFVQKSNSKISVSEYIPTIHKQNKGRENDETSWELNFNTGVSSSDIKITDKIKVSTEEESLKEIIEKAMILKDLEIEVEGTVIYKNKEFVSPWEDNITITEKALGYEFQLKNTTENAFIEKNQNVIIRYKSALDYEKYNTKQKSGVFSLENTATIEKDGLTSEDIVQANGIDYEFPMDIKKEYLGNSGNDLTETNWIYTVESGKLDRENVLIQDTANLGIDFGKYLSISKLKISKNDTILYDSEQDIDNLGTIKLRNTDQENLVLYQNGTYQFEIEIPKLEKMTTLKVEYSLKVDEKEYKINDEILDNELLIKNNVKLTCDDETNIEKEDRGSSKVLSKLNKKFDFLGYDNDGNPRIKWYINVNLLSDYQKEELEGKTVIIKDVLSDILKLKPNSVHIKERHVTNNGETIGKVISNNQYELNTENNTIEITIQDPTQIPSMQIEFETICYASVSELENYATLQVGDDDITEIKSSQDIEIFSPYAFGVITSKELINYNIHGRKTLDGENSNKPFVFEITEVEENGERKENGFHSENTNGEDGIITFNAIQYGKEGIYYYKIKEVKEENTKVLYDETEYTVRIKVVENHGKYIVEDISLMNSDKDEILFENKTISEEEKPINVIINPKTGRYLILIVLLFASIIVGYTLSKKTI